MNWPLFRATLRANWLIAVFFTLFILIYVTTSVAMFDPESAQALTAMLDALPEGLTRAMGFENLGTDMTQYVSNYLFGFIMLIFPMIYSIIIGNRLVAKHVDSGSMAYLLTTPNSRVRIATTQAVYLVVSLGAIMAVELGVAIVMSSSTYPGELNAGTFLTLGAINYLVHLVIAGVAFFASCLFSETRYSLALGAGLPAFFFVARLVANFGGQFEWVRYLTVFSFVNIERILAVDGFSVTAAVILAPMALVLFAAGVIVFDRKSLAL